MHGYITDATYADRFFRELSPAWLNYVAAVNGIAPRDLGRPFAYLELGCGFRASVVVNAGAFPHAEFHACDLNAEHIAGAQRHAGTLGIGNLHLVQESFESLAWRPLPELDFIVLHGVYSWVTPEARSAVREILRRK